MVPGGLEEKEFESLAQCVMRGDEGQGDLDGCLHGRRIKALGHLLAVGFGGTLLADLGQVGLAGGMVHRGQGGGA